MNEEIFFEDLFKSLLEESEEFVIRYKYKMVRFKDEEYIQFDIDSVNEKKSIWQFKARIKELCKKGLDKLNEVLEVSSIEDRLNLLEYFAEEFSGLKNKVAERVEVYPESEWEEGGVVKYNAFVVSKIIGIPDDKHSYHKKSIEKKASKFANGWLEIINDSKDKIDFLINQAELLPKADEIMKDPNTIHIFYSWQSDNDDERKLIRKGLTNTTKELKKSGKTLIIDSDMRNVPGSEDIPNTLFNKIENSDIFVADLNLVFKSFIRENVCSPNPNVLIELGYAAAKLGWNKIILVLNISSNKIEDLPFDIRQRAIIWHKGTDEEITKKLTFAIKKMIK